MAEKTEFEIPNATIILEMALAERNFKTRWLDFHTLVVEDLTPDNLKRLEDYLSHLKSGGLK